jgi:hypothetical protein
VLPPVLLHGVASASPSPLQLVLIGLGKRLADTQQQQQQQQAWGPSAFHVSPGGQQGACQGRRRRAAVRVCAGSGGGCLGGVPHARAAWHRLTSVWVNGAQAAGGALGSFAKSHSVEGACVHFWAASPLDDAAAAITAFSSAALAGLYEGNIRHRSKPESKVQLQTVKLWVPSSAAPGLAAAAARGVAIARGNLLARWVRCVCVCTLQGAVERRWALSGVPAPPPANRPGARMLSCCCRFLAEAPANVCTPTHLAAAAAHIAALAPDRFKLKVGVRVCLWCMLQAGCVTLLTSTSLALSRCCPALRSGRARGSARGSATGARTLPVATQHPRLLRCWRSPRAGSSAWGVLWAFPRAQRSRCASSTSPTPPLGRSSTGCVCGVGAMGGGQSAGKQPCVVDGWWLKQ